MVYRITLKGIQKSQTDDSESEIPWEGSIIYKCLPENVVMREAFKSDELFCNEVAFYNKIWPTLANFQSQWGSVKDPFNSIPKCYLARNDCVVLKDLKQYGFVMPDRKQGLTIEQTYVVLKNLAHFHALSLAMKCHSPDEFYELLNSKDGISEVFFLSENDDYYKEYYREAIHNAIAMVEEELQDSEDKELYLEKFKEFCSEDTFFKNMVDLVAPSEPLAVICHGDCWTNNFLFRSVDGAISEMYLVDFQLVRYASPALDLAYIMYLCLERWQRVEHLTPLLRHYTAELHQRLLELSDDDSLFCGAPNEEALYELLLKEFKEKSRFGLGIALDMYPIMKCESNEAPNLYQSKDNESTSSIQPVWTSNAACRRKMTELVRELVDEGAI
ncbi:hypothetical protein O3G_MSEX007083 [Manduca sexta]|uniref:CHK kinase-like domain-containing protein n=2 Tax=Manduca sexta TaxID=7130 RepID=A0A921Z4V7_MANSE|nr:hypothetical protein O3G_MSEX007083 [Manduca sexta]